MKASADPIRYYRSGRPVIMGRNGIVSSGHYLASLSGIKALQDGGNAIDAALAASFVLSVVRPHACGVGGDLFAMVFMHKRAQVEALNASGPAPGRATIDFFKAMGLSRIPLDGPLSVAVPGIVDGWMALHSRYGSLELERLAADAIGYARDGFPLYPSLLESILDLAPIFPWIHRNFRQPLGDLAQGRILRQPDLAHTLERIVAGGRKVFYEGEIGARMCRALQMDGGLMVPEDLAGPHAEWLPPLTAGYEGYAVFEQPPVSQGFLVLEMLNIIEEYGLTDLKPVEVVHLMVEAKKLAFEDRIRNLEDPHFGDPPIAMLISKEHARARTKMIAHMSVSRGSDSPSLGGDTTYLCAADRDGNVVSLIQSVFSHFGSGVVAGDTGLVMNNRLCSFNLDRRKANALVPGKRPAHTLNSYMVLHDGELFAAGGTPGADDQPQTNVQVLHNLIHRRMDPQSSIEAPRWSHRPGTPPAAEGPEELRLEQGFPPEVVEGLSARGHRVTVVDRWAFGDAAVIVRDPVTGTWMGGADPRRESYAIGW